MPTPSGAQPFPPGRPPPPRASLAHNPSASSRPSTAGQPPQASGDEKRLRNWRAAGRHRVRQRAPSGPFRATQPLDVSRPCDHLAMVLEHALLSVKPGEEQAFEAAFTQAKPIIGSMPGFGRLTLSRCLEQTSTYLLLVEWDRLEDHTVGFRGSPQYQQWRSLLHHFYEPFPTVEHYEQVLSA